MKRKHVCLLGFVLTVHILATGSARCEGIPTLSGPSPVEITTPTLPPGHADDEYSPITSPALTVPDKAMAPATVGRPYHDALVIQGGSGERTVTAEALPEGLSMDEKGAITGTPLASPGTFTCFLIVNDLGPMKKTLRKAFDITVYPPFSSVFEGPGPVLVRSQYSASVRATGGSGSYAMGSTDLPAGLSISSTGIIKGPVTLKRGVYPLTVTLEDKKTGIVIVEKQALEVVDYFPDPYETMNDGGFDTLNVVRPGSVVQSHTFDKPGDKDTVTLDLKAVVKDSVILLDIQNGSETPWVSLTLYDGEHAVVAKRHSDHSLPFFFRCSKPGVYHAVIETAEGQTGSCSFGVHTLGKAAEIPTVKLADVSRFTDSRQVVSAMHGSGSYRFSSFDLPEGLILDPLGTVHGRAAVAPGQYPMKIRVEDRLYPGTYFEKEFVLTVVDYFPDAYEALGDHDFSTGNTLKPGAAAQIHTLHTGHDEDAIKVDLSGIPADHVIHPEATAVSDAAKLSLEVYDGLKTPLPNRLDGNPEDQAEVFFKKGPMDPVYVRIKDRNMGTGQYRFAVKDLGPAVDFVKGNLPDALRRGDYSHTITAEKGSGHYRFTSDNLPAHLTLTADGVIHGHLDLEPGLYPFHVRVYDANFIGTSSEMDVVLKVVEYFPDAYEPLGDGNFETTNALSPGSPEQAHTFHQPGDVDVLRLDLGSCRPGDVIRILVPGATEGGALAVELYDMEGKFLDKMERKNSSEPLKMVYECKKPGLFYLKASQIDNRPGCYTIKVDHCGPKLQLLEAVLPIAESDSAYSFSIGTQGGNGKSLFIVSGGALPEGLRLGQETSEIKGSNKTWGKAIFTVTATDVQFPENKDSREYSVETFMGRKLKGTDHVTFPHYVSGAFSWDENRCSTTAFPAHLEGGTQTHIRFRLLSHNIPADRFETFFDEKTGCLRITEKIPLSCKEYIDTDLFADVQAEDSVHTNNTFKIRYAIPVRCLEY